MEIQQGSWKKRSRRSVRDVAQPASAFGAEGHAQAFDDLIELVASFNDHQLALAKSTSFGVFAEWSSKIKFDMNFSKWLLMHVDYVDRCILTGREFNIPVDARAASRIIGLPSWGIDIISGEVPEREAGRLIVREFLGIKANATPSITAARNVLLRRREMPDLEDDTIFKAAFVIYIMAFLTGSYELQLGRVLSELLPPGCNLFLQALYLDNIVFPSDPHARSYIPRLSIYNQDRIGRLILLDTKELHGIPPVRVFGGGKLFSIENIGKKQRYPQKKLKQVVEVSECSVVREDRQVEAGSSGGVSVQASVIVASNCFKARCLKHLNIARKAIEAEAVMFASSVEEANKVPSTGAVTFRPTNSEGPLHPRNSVIQNAPGVQGTAGSDRTVTPKVTERTTLPEDSNCFTDENTPPSDVSTWQDFSATKPPSLKGKHTFLSSSDSRFLSKSFVTARNALNSIKIEMQQSKEGQGILPSPKLVQVSVMFQKSPWEVGFSSPTLDHKSVKDFYVFATTNNNGNGSFWVIHCKPSIIKLSASVIGSELRMGGRASSSVTDIAFRRFKQQDQSLYGEEECVTWRHYVETGLWVLAKSKKEEDDLAAARKLFIGEHITYDAWRCQLILAMADLEGSWMALAWDMKRSKLTVFVPGLVDSDGGVITQVREAVDRMDDALRTCIAKFFEGWAVNWDHWSRVYCHDSVRGCKDSLDRRAESGFTCLKFCKTFTGVLHDAYTPDLGSCLETRQNLLFHIMNIKQNMGQLPQQFVQDLDD
ncbi:unnamed protein product [Alopecurus aequalis]